MKGLFAGRFEGIRWRYRSAKKLTFRAIYQRRLRGLQNVADPNGRRLASVMKNLQRGEFSGGESLIEAIETGRASMLSSGEPLVDGTLGRGGIYDEGGSVREACVVSKNRHSATFLHLLVREFKPSAALELGTNVGISSAYQAAALKLNGGGRLITLESSPYRLRLAKRLHEELELTDYVEYREGLFGETLGRALEESGPVDYAFIDGHHRYRPTLDYFEAICSRAKDGAIFVFDDIVWSSGMRRAWGEIKADRRVAVAADFGTMGVCVTAGKQPDRGRYVTKQMLLL
jgi:predicted O-methyltransferase YrrM